MFRFLIKTTSIRPITNSNPPKPRIKKVIDVEVISLITDPTIVDNTNNTNQVNSANNSTVTKLLILKKNNPNDNQKKITKKSNQLNILFIIQ